MHQNLIRLINAIKIISNVFVGMINTILIGLELSQGQDYVSLTLWNPFHVLSIAVWLD